MEKRLSDFDPVIDRFYDKHEVLICNRDSFYTFRGWRTSGYNLPQMLPYYYLPTDKTFEFTGLINKELTQEVSILLLEAEYNGNPYYYPFQFLNQQIFQGELKDAKLIGRRDKGELTDYFTIEIKKVNWPEKNFLSIYEIIQELFECKWQAKEVGGYVPNLKAAKAVEPNKRKSTNWHSKKFVEYITIYRLIKSQTDITNWIFKP